MTKRQPQGAPKHQKAPEVPSGASWAPPGPQRVSVGDYIAVRARKPYLASLAGRHERRTLDEWATWEQALLDAPA